MIKEELKNFLKDPKIQSLINENRFEEVYNIYKKIGFKNDLTAVFLKADINFLAHMERIPTYCFSGLWLPKSFEIPSNIKVIEEGAFKDVRNEDDKIIFNPGLEVIEEDIFGSYTEMNIIFRGTEEQWFAIKKSSINSGIRDRLATRSMKIILEKEDNKVIYKWNK